MVNPQDQPSIAQPKTDAPLPSFERPPVIEVAFSVQFAPLPGFTSIHYGQFLECVNDKYPKTEDRGPVADQFEPVTTPSVTAEAFNVPPLRRVFYLDESGNFLLQVQPSRFMTNWRKLQDTDQYPRFAAPYTRFRDGWDVFLHFAEERRLGHPRADQYELTYINHLEAFDQPFPKAIEQLVPAFSWTSTRSIDFLPFPSGIALVLRFPLPENNGSLHLKMELGRRNRDQKGVLVVDFTARGPALPDWSNMNSWFAMAHEWVVKGFTDLTSQEAHRHWGRRE